MNGQQINNQKPPGQGQSRSARRRRNRRLRSINQPGIPSGNGQPRRRRQQNNARPGLGRGSNTTLATRSNFENDSNRVLQSQISESGQADGVASYVAAVMDPQLALPTRCPTFFPYPSACTKLSWSGIVQCNATGNVSIMCQPQVGTLGDWNEFVCVLRDDSLNAANNWEQRGGVGSHATCYLEQKLRAQDFTRWRVVGASLKAAYIGPISDSSGYMISAFMPMGILRGTQNAVAANNVVQANYATWSEEQLLEAYYHTTITDFNQTAECLFIPRDDVDLQYIARGNKRETSTLVINGYGMKAGSYVRWGFDLIMEYIPTATNYIAEVKTVQPGMDGSLVIQRLANEVPSYITSPASDASIYKTIKSKASIYALKGLKAFGNAALDAATAYSDKTGNSVTGQLIQGLSSMISGAGKNRYNYMAIDN